MNGMTTIKVSFGNFDIALKNLRTKTHTGAYVMLFY